MKKVVDRTKQPANNYFEHLPLDVLKIILGLFSKHEQFCQLSRLSYRFRKGVSELLASDQTIARLNDKSAQYKLPSYTSHRLFHASRVWEPDSDQMLANDLSFAGFIGDEAAMIGLLGKNYFEHKDETGRTVAHFASLGGQLPWLKKLVREHGKSVILIKDKADFSCVHYAAMGLHIPTLQWLVNEHDYSMLDKQGQFKTSGMDCLNTSLIKSHTALLLAPLLCEKREADVQTESTDLSALNSKFREIENQPSENTLCDQTLDQLIISSVQKMIAGEMGYSPLLNELVQYKSITQQEPEIEPHKFLC